MKKVTVLPSGGLRKPAIDRDHNWQIGLHHWAVTELSGLHIPAKAPSAAPSLPLLYYHITLKLISNSTVTPSLLLPSHGNRRSSVFHPLSAAGPINEFAEWKMSFSKRKKLNRESNFQFRPPHPGKKEQIVPTVTRLFNRNTYAKITCTSETFPKSRSRPTSLHRNPSGLARNQIRNLRTKRTDRILTSLYDRSAEEEHLLHS